MDFLWDNPLYSFSDGRLGMAVFLAAILIFVLNVKVSRLEARIRNLEGDDK